MVVLLSACGTGKQDGATPGPDGGAAPACADTTKVIAIPTPAWQTGARLAAPPGDRAAAIVAEERPKWLEQIALVDGWAQRPTVVLPLDGVATSADPSKIALYGSTGGGAPSDLKVAVEARLSEDGRSAVVQPRDAVPPGPRDLVLVVRKGAFAGAHALPACGADARPDPAYAATAATLPTGTDADLALPLRLGTMPQELVRLADRLAKTPALAVAKVEARTLASFGADGPAAETAKALAPTAASGILELPAYSDAAGIFAIDADGVPKATGVTKPGFVVALPATGTAPFPWVLYQHGGGQKKTDFFQLARRLAEAGFAFVAIDLPYHGDRGKAGGGGDLDFLDFDSIARMRESFRQTIADHTAVVTGVAALNKALDPVLGVPSALDAARAFYMGLSLGGISGSMTFAVARPFVAAAVFVGGGGYPDLVAKGPFSIFVSTINARPMPERDAIFVVGEAILDGADPIGYGIRVEDRSARPRPIVFFQAVTDPIVTTVASDQWARAFGARLAQPRDHAVAGMDETALPASDNFAFAPGGQKATRLLVQAPMKEVPVAEQHGGLIRQDYAQQAVEKCFSSWRATGSCALTDTGWAAH